MYIPRLPTDNLYKFLALSGMLVVALAATIPYVSQREAERRLIDVEASLQRIQLETEHIGSEVLDLAKNVGLTPEGDTISDEELQRWLEAELEVPASERPGVVQRAQALKERNLELRLKTVELEADTSRLRQFAEEAEPACFLRVPDSCSGT